MKIIDLLNKIANDEDVPKKIKINNNIYVYRGDDYLFKDEKNDNHEYWLFSAGYTDKFQWLDSFLKAEVEIIEEENKIEKIDVIPYEKCIHEVTHKEKEILLEIRDIQMKFNKIIDYLMENKQ